MSCPYTFALPVEGRRPLPRKKDSSPRKPLRLGRGLFAAYHDCFQRLIAGTNPHPTVSSILIRRMTAAMGPLRSDDYAIFGTT